MQQEAATCKKHSVRHFQQRHSWDCGISCVLMILDSDSRSCLLENLASICNEEGFGDSTWTIDLCYLLRRFGVRFMYATRTLGVDPGYVSEGFYRRVLDKDDSRVNKRFREAAANGVTVEQRTCLIQEMCDHLQNHGPCIVLVNANILRCRAEDHMGQKKASLVLDGRNLFSCCSSSSAVKSSSYQGHFILAVGFDATSEVVTFHNPSRKEGTCATSFHNFDEARTSYGTDEDVIFIYSNK